MSVSTESVVLIQGGVLSVYGSAAALMDLRRRRIPNSLTLSGLFLALLLRLVLGWPSLLDGLAGLGLGLGIGIALYAFRVWGAGDGKLLTMLGAFLGLGRLPGALALAALIGGVMAVIQAGRRGVLIPAFLNIRRLLTGFTRGGKSEPRIAMAGVLTLPYGVPLALGGVLWWFLGGTWP